MVASWELFSFASGDPVARMAVVAVIMTVRGEHFTAIEKVVWVLLAFGFLFLDIRVIHQDRDAHDAQQHQA